MHVYKVHYTIQHNQTRIWKLTLYFIFEYVLCRVFLCPTFLFQNCPTQIVMFFPQTIGRKQLCLLLGSAAVFINRKKNSFFLQFSLYSANVSNNFFLLYKRKLWTTQVVMISTQITIWKQQKTKIPHAFFRPFGKTVFVQAN